MADQHVSVPDRNQHHQDLFALAGRLTEMGDRHTAAALRSAGYEGLRRGHGRVLVMLAAGPETVGDLARRLGVTQQAVSKTVGELVELGYVEQRRDTNDARRRPSHLSSRGREAVEVVQRSRRQLLRHLAADPAGRPDIVESLHRLLERAPASLR